MRPMLSDIELPQVQELRTSDLRAVAEHMPAGKDGSLLQNLGRAPTTVTVWGMATDPGSLDLLDRLKQELRTGVAVSFVSDITTDTTIEQVLVDDLQMRQVAGKPDRFAYVLTLREFIEPVEPESTAAVDADLLDDAAGLLDDLVEGLDVAAAFASGLGSFMDPLSNLLERLAQFRDQVQANQ